MLTQWRNHSWNIRIVDRPSSDDSTDSSSDTFVTIPSDPVQESTGTTDQPAIRYLQVRKGEPQVAIIGISPSAMTPPDNRLMR